MESYKILNSINYSNNNNNNEILTLNIKFGK